MSWFVGKWVFSRCVDVMSVRESNIMRVNGWCAGKWVGDSDKWDNVWVSRWLGEWCVKESNIMRLNGWCVGKWVSDSDKWDSVWVSRRLGEWCSGLWVNECWMTGCVVDEGLMPRVSRLFYTVGDMQNYMCCRLRYHPRPQYCQSLRYKWHIINDIILNVVLRCRRHAKLHVPSY